MSAPPPLADVRAADTDRDTTFARRVLSRPQLRRPGFQKITVPPRVLRIERIAARNGVSLSRVRWLERLLS